MIWCATTDGLAIDHHGSWSQVDLGENVAADLAPDGTAYVLTSGGTF